jgi:hypothetical protein
MVEAEIGRHPVIAVLEGAKIHIENAINAWMDGGRPLGDLALIIQWVEDGKGRVAPVDRDRFAQMIDPPEDVRQRHANAANVLVACQIAAQLRHRVNGFTPVVLNFDAEDGAVSRVVLLRFVDGEMDVKANSGGLA